MKETKFFQTLGQLIVNSSKPLVMKDRALQTPMKIFRVSFGNIQIISGNPWIPSDLTKFFKNAGSMKKSSQSDIHSRFT